MSAEPEAGSESTPAPSGLRLHALIVFATATAAAAAIGSMFPPGEWYASLEKPAWNPPDWIFGPVWTVLYVAMAIAGWLSWRHAPTRRMAHLATVAWAVQLLLNALWSPLFFGLHRPLLALADIAAQLFALVVAIMLAWRCHRVAALLLVPCAIWVSFAGLLNAALWILNK